MTAVNAAVALFTPKIEIFEEERLDTSRNFFPVSRASESGDEPPVATGDAVPRCNAPDVWSKR